MARVSPARLALPALVLATAGLLGGCENPAGPAEAATLTPDAPSHAADQSCWGQATKVFAQLGEMGPHSSGQPSPRLGLANLARALYDLGVISAPTMEALGQFVADELGLSIDECST